MTMLADLHDLSAAEFAEAIAPLQSLLDTYHAKRADARARFGQSFAGYRTAVPPCSDLPLDRAVAGESPMEQAA
ncbi:hypothetical protein [Rhodanobacter hydrolyticus]|uniref:Uncharacterized protein n=1 Tax=Rhodanobacter hydrolyticus TaxID=2250595 RepID=A0ABW8J5P6_9GAMM